MKIAHKKSGKRSVQFVLFPTILILLFLFLLILNKVTSSPGSSVYITDPDTSVAEGDSVHIDYTGTIDGEIFENSSTQGSGAVLKIGSGSYVDGFEEQLIGTHPGDTVNVSVTFPEDYSSLALRGQDAVFEVTLHGIFR